MLHTEYRINLDSQANLSLTGRDLGRTQVTAGSLWGLPCRSSEEGFDDDQEIEDRGAPPRPTPTPT
eukprot:scaffold189568_cov28-Tisochrysis_lutea.AAC.2